MFHIINFDGEHNIDCVEINEDYLVIDYLGNQSEEWKVDEEGIINANCSCMDCREGLIHSHRLCSTAYPEAFNALEDMNLLYRDFIHSGWRWMIVK